MYVFYGDGTIESELEFSRYDTRHFTGDRVDGNSYLEQVIVEETNFDIANLRPLFGTTKYAQNLQLPDRQQILQKYHAFLDLWNYGMYYQLNRYANILADITKLHGADLLDNRPVHGSVLLALGIIADFLIARHVRPQEGFPQTLYQTIKSALYLNPLSSALKSFNTPSS